MLTIYSDDHRLHHGRCELIDGKLMPCFEMPSRADHVLDQVKNATSVTSRALPTSAARPCCASTAPTTWTFRRRLGALGGAGPGRRPAAVHLACTHLAPGKPTGLHGELGYYSFDAGAPITAGTWQAAYSAAQVALTARQRSSRRA